MKSCGSEVFWPWHEVWLDRIGSEAFFVCERCHDVMCRENGVVLACFEQCFPPVCRRSSGEVGGLDLMCVGLLIVRNRTVRSKLM